MAVTATDLGEHAPEASGPFTTAVDAPPLTRIILTVWYFDNVVTLTGASGGGLTWVVDRQVHTTGGGHSIGIISAYAPAGLPAGTVITVTYSGTPTIPAWVAATAFTELASGSSGYIDVVATSKSGDTSQNWSTNNLVTTNAADMLFSVTSAINAGTGNTATSPATEIHDSVSTGSNRLCDEYRVVSATGTYTLQGTWQAAPGGQGGNVAVAYKTAPAFTTHSASAALSGAGTLAATAKRTTGASAALAGSGVLAATAIRHVLVSAALGATSALSASAVRLGEVAAHLTGQGTLAATGLKTAKASAALTGTGSLAAAVRSIWAATGSLTGAGVLAATARRIAEARAALTGHGTLQANAGDVVTTMKPAPRLVRDEQVFIAEGEPGYFRRGK